MKAAGEGRLQAHSNRPVEVKRFQAIHYCGVGTTRGLALLFGIGTEALPAWEFEDKVERSFAPLLGYKQT